MKRLTKFPVEALALKALCNLNLSNNAIPAPLPPAVVEVWGDVDAKRVALEAGGDVEVTVRGNPCADAAAPAGGAGP